MKKIISVFSVIAMTVGLTTVSSIQANAFELPDEGAVYMYRLYNPNSGEHFYTATDKEKNHLVSIGWRDEGFGWIGEEDQGDPVYRLYNANGGEHHYTMSEKERDSLIALGWKDEGIGWYSYDESVDTSYAPKAEEPVYREYNPNAFANNHNYTTDKAEHDHLISLGWRDEGVAWYAKYRNVLGPVTGVQYNAATRTVSWNPVKNATSYQLDFEKIIDGNPYTEIIYETVHGTSYVLPQADGDSDDLTPGTPGKYGVLIVAYDEQNHYLDNYSITSPEETYFEVK